MSELRQFDENAMRKIARSVFREERKSAFDLTANSGRMRGRGGLSRQANEVFPIAFSNNSGEVIPARAIMQVEDCWQKKGREALIVTKPDSVNGHYLVNGTQDIAIDGNGFGTWGTDGCLFLYDTSETITAGDTMGPKSGEWKAYRGSTGFIAIGEPYGDLAQGIQIKKRESTLHYLKDVRTYDSAATEHTSYTDSTLYLAFDNSQLPAMTLGNGTERIITLNPYLEGCVKFTRGGFYKVHWHLALGYSCTAENYFTSTNTGTADSHNHTYDKVNASALNSVILTASYDIQTPSGTAPASPNDVAINTLPHVGDSQFGSWHHDCTFYIEPSPNAVLRLIVNLGGNDFSLYGLNNYLAVEYLRADLDP